MCKFLFFVVYNMCIKLFGCSGCFTKLLRLVVHPNSPTCLVLTLRRSPLAWVARPISMQLAVALLLFFCQPSLSKTAICKMPKCRLLAGFKRSLKVLASKGSGNALSVPSVTSYTPANSRLNTTWITYHLQRLIALIIVCPIYLFILIFFSSAVEQCVLFQLFLHHPLFEVEIVARVLPTVSLVALVVAVPRRF